MIHLLNQRFSFPGAVWKLGLLLAALVFGEQAALSAAEPTRAKPNIVFILFDDMGYGQPPCFREKSEFKTPSLDRLAREGMRFTDAHTASAVCTPTRYGILTGRYPMRIGQYGVLTTFSPAIIEKERLTVPGFLKKHGYHTAGIGKWHLGMTWDGKQKKKDKNVPLIGTVVGDGPIMRGFDFFAGYTHARNMGMILEQNKVAANIKDVDVQPLMAKKAVAYIDERARLGGPFFLYLPLSTPHTPIVPAEEFVGKSGAQKYGDWLYQGDWVMGQVLQALERHKLANNTLVIVTSDNGAAGRVYAPLRGCKTHIYEGGHRVPFIARWPGKIQPGSTCADTVCLNDLLATCADLLGDKLPANAGEDSFSILPDLLGTAKGPIREATIHQSPAGDVAIRQGPWKLIFLKSGVKELYNLKDDLSETRNVAAAHADVVDRLTKLIQQYIANGRSTPGPAQKNAVKIKLGQPAKGKEVTNALDPAFD